MKEKVSDKKTKTTKKTATKSTTKTTAKKKEPEFVITVKDEVSKPVRKRKTVTTEEKVVPKKRVVKKKEVEVKEEPKKDIVVKTHRKYYRVLMILSVILFVITIIQMCVIGVNIATLYRHLGNDTLDIFVNGLTRNFAVFSGNNLIVLRNGAPTNEIILFYFFSSVSNLFVSYLLGIMFAYLAEFVKTIDYQTPFNRKSLIIIDKAIVAFIGTGIIKLIFGALSLVYTSFELVDISIGLVWVLIIMIVLMFRNIIGIKED